MQQQKGDCFPFPSAPESTCYHTFDWVWLCNMLIMMPEVFSESYPHYTITATLFRIWMICSMRNDKNAGMIILDAPPSLYIEGTFLCRSDTFWGECCGQAVVMNDNTEAGFNSFLALHHHCCCAILKVAGQFVEVYSTFIHLWLCCTRPVAACSVFLTSCNNEQHQSDVSYRHESQKVCRICWHLVAKKKG